MGINFKKLQITPMTCEYLATQADYDAAVTASKDKPLIIDFTATWCPPCKMIGPKFEAMSKEFEAVTFRKVDVDANAEAAQTAGINCMPTFKVYKDGAEVEKMEGADEAGLKALIQKYC